MGPRTVTRITLSRLAPDGQLSVESRRYRLVGRPAAVLVDQRGRWGVMAHPGHEVAEARARLRRERVPGMPEVVQVQARYAEAFAELCPTDLTC